MVRKVPVTTQRIQYEERVEEIPVQVCKTVVETKKVAVPRTVAKWVPYVTTRYVPRTVTMRVPTTSEVIYSTTTNYPSMLAPAEPPQGSIVAAPEEQPAAGAGNRQFDLGIGLQKIGNGLEARHPILPFSWDRCRPGP